MIYQNDKYFMLPQIFDARCAADALYLSLIDLVVSLSKEVEQSGRKGLKNKDIEVHLSVEYIAKEDE